MINRKFLPPMAGIEIVPITPSEFTHKKVLYKSFCTLSFLLFFLLNGSQKFLHHLLNLKMEVTEVHIALMLNNCLQQRAGIWLITLLSVRITIIPITVLLSYCVRQILYQSDYDEFIW